MHWAGDGTIVHLPLMQLREMLMRTNVGDRKQFSRNLKHRNFLAPYSRKKTLFSVQVL